MHCDVTLGWCDAYLAALKMLARRELSEAQVRQRLTRRAARPRSDRCRRRPPQGRAQPGRRARRRRDRAVGDRPQEARAAACIRQIEAAGIAPAIARRVVDETFADDRRRCPAGRRRSTRRLRGRAASRTTRGPASVSLPRRARVRAGPSARILRRSAARPASSAERRDSDAPVADRATQPAGPTIENDDLKRDSRVVSRLLRAARPPHRCRARRSCRTRTRRCSSPTPG